MATQSFKSFICSRLGNDIVCVLFCLLGRMCSRERVSIENNDDIELCILQNTQAEKLINPCNGCEDMLNRYFLGGRGEGGEFWGAELGIWELRLCNAV